MADGSPVATPVRKRVYRFLEERGGVASSLAIVASVLGLRNAQPSVAAKVVTGLLDGDPLFVSDGLGNWHLDPCRSLIEWRLSERPITVVAASRARLGTREIAEIAFVDVRRGDEAFFRLESDQAAWWLSDHADRSISDENTLRRWLSRLDDGAWVAFQPSRIRRLLQRCGEQYLGRAGKGAELSLQRLARRILPGHTIRSLDDLARLLELGGNSAETTVTSSRLAAEVWSNLVEKLCGLGIETLEQTLAFQEKKAEPIDFSRFEFGREFLERLPESPGVYIMRNRDGEVIYVGKARSLARRVGSYFVQRAAPNPKTKQLLAHLYRIELRRTGNELDALLLESKLIRRHLPEVNRQIEIRVQDGGPSRAGNVALVLPAYGKGRVVVCLLSQDRRLQRFSISPGKIDVEALEHTLRDFLEVKGPKRRRPASREWQIASRWLDEHEQVVSSVVLDSYANLKEAAATVHRLASDPEALHARTIHVMRGFDAEEDSDGR